MNLTSAQLTLIAPDRVCRDPHWQGTTNVVHVVLHDGSVPEADLVRLFPRWQSPWGLSIQAPYAPPRPDENESAALTVLLRAEGAQVHPYKLGAFTQSGPTAAVPLKKIADGIGAASFFLRLEESRTDPVSLTACVVFRGIIVAETQSEVPTSEMGGVEVVCQQDTAFKRVFVSYAREDLCVVEYINEAVSSLGLIDYRWDLKVLKSGDDWAEVVRQEIDKADSFQLFWSQAAATSREVRKEWKYAMELKGKGFVRPVYWQEPLAPLPPRELKPLHFCWINIPPGVTPVVPPANDEATGKKRPAGKSRFGKSP